MLVCNESQTALVCSGDEVCNGKDDDCDNTIDEGVSYQDPASGMEHFTNDDCVGQGACADSAGTYQCHNGEVVCSADLEGSAETFAAAAATAREFWAAPVSV